jgi:hypothetical protein
MFSFPWAMVVGGVLISSPIIIHLINRMRFKRIRWAAMEFLLKSQKRNRRRLIIEQIILLLLRIILVLLAALLVARFVFAGVFDKKNTLHVIVFDDTPSMSDHWTEEGEKRDAFAVGKQLIVDKIVKNVAHSNTSHSLQLLLLSSTQDFDYKADRLNSESEGELKSYLANVKPSAIHVDLLKGVQKAQAIFDANTQDLRVLHIVSDFRQRDWTETGSDESAGLGKTLELLQKGGVKVRLVDVAHPVRGPSQKGAALYHDNMAVTDLRPETRIAGRAMPVQFTVAVTNFSASERKNVRVTIKVNGSERADASVTLDSVPPDAPKKALFTIYFEKTGFNLVTANLEDEESGLQIDNTRYAVVEVKDRVPLLVIDGDPANSNKPGGDTYHVQAVFDKLKGAAKGYDLLLRGASELEQPNLDQYPSIYLLNVRDLSEKAVQNLETYVREGGSVAFFLGDRVNPEYYNSKLYRDGKGVFPAPLAGRPFPPLSADELKPEFSLDQNQIFLRRKSDPMPVFEEVYASYLDGVFKFLPIKRYFPVVRSRWHPEPGRTQELVTLPNRKSVEDYRDSAQILIEKLPTRDPSVARYRSKLEDYQDQVRKTLSSGEPLYKLANVLERMLKDEGKAKEAEESVNLVELFGKPEFRALRDEIDQFREMVQYGDPLVIASRFGKGKVVTFLTSAGQKWNHWAGGSMPYVMATYPIVMVEVQKYLTGLAEDVDQSVGSTLSLQLDGSRYDPKMKRFRLPEPKIEQPKSGDPVLMGEQSAKVGKDNRLTFDFDEAREPGVYLFEFTPLGTPGGTEGKTVQKAVAFNVDTHAESDLRRVPGRDDLLAMAGQDAILQTADSAFDEDANRQSDLSEMPWLFLAILLVLLLEQALAVHLSFHLKGGEATPQAAASPQPSAI